MGRPRTRARESGIRHAQAFRQMPPLRQQILSHSKQQSPFSKGFVMYVVVSSPQCGKNTAFFQFSTWRDPRLRHFSGYPFGASRKKASTIFYSTAFPRGSTMTKLAVLISYNSKVTAEECFGPVMAYVCLISTIWRKIQTFSPAFPLAGFMAEAFCWLFPWNFKEKDISHFLWRSLFYWLFLWNFKKIRHQPFPTAQPNFLPWGSPTSPPEKPNTLSTTVTSHQQAAIMGLFKRLCKYVFVSSPQCGEK